MDDDFIRHIYYTTLITTHKPMPYKPINFINMSKNEDKSGYGYGYGRGYGDG